MKFTETILAGAYLIDPEPIADERGYFARTWCRGEFADHHLNPDIVQCNVSFNLHRGTLRGMHYQSAPHEEAKLVRCTQGAIYDVIVDIRPSSETFKSWIGVELSAENHRMLYIPEGFAHGFQTLADGSEVFYQMSAPYVSKAVRGFRWDDPVFSIKWPEAATVISEADRSYCSFEEPIAVA